MGWERRPFPHGQPGDREGEDTAVRPCGERGRSQGERDTRCSLVTPNQAGSLGSCGPRALVCINSSGVPGTGAGLGQARVWGGARAWQGHGTPAVVTHSPQGRSLAGLGSPELPGHLSGAEPRPWKSGRYQGWVLGTPLPYLAIQGSRAWVTLGTSHCSASSRDPVPGCPMSTVLGQGTALEALWALCHWGCTRAVLACGCRDRLEGMFAICARFSRYLVLAFWCPFWHAGVQSGMLVLHQGMDSSSRVQLQSHVPGGGYWNTGTCTGMQYWKWNTGSHSRLQILYWDTGITPGSRSHTRM